MGSISRIEGPVFVDGEQSLVLTRQADRDKEDGWSVEQRPYRNVLGDELFRDAGTTPMTCLLAGNRVLMADGSRKPIECVRAEDRVMTMAGPKAVEKAETTTLGLTRRVIELRGQADEALFLSSDHPLWVSRPDSAGGRKEWWGTFNIHHFLFEVHNGVGLNLREQPFILHIDLPEQIAHVSGWLHARPIFHDLAPTTKLFHLIVRDGFSYIAEGFPVLSHCRDQQGPEAPWKGLDDGAALALSMEQVLAKAS